MKRTSFDDGQPTADILSCEILSGETQLSNNGYWASEINNWYVDKSIKFKWKSHFSFFFWGAYYSKNC